MINRKYALNYSIILASLLSLLFWFFLFLYTLNPKNNTGTVVDKFSSESISMEAVNDSSVKNPNMPYFVGFNYLTKYGTSKDDVDYIKDFLGVYSMYSLKESHAKISFVKDSYQQGGSGTERAYSFSIAINDSDIHTVKVASDIVSNKITIALFRDKIEVIKKTLDINEVYY